MEQVAVFLQNVVIREGRARVVQVKIGISFMTDSRSISHCDSEDIAI